MVQLQQHAEEMMAHHGFLGVPIETFARGGREKFIALLNLGLTPESRVVDLGCGCLRIAYWLIRFLDKRSYCGIEPARNRVEYGLQYLFAPDEIARKQPRFHYNADFNTSVFSTTFDFFLACSIWTHASKRQIEASLDSFTRDTGLTGVMLTSYLPARTRSEDYLGDAWVGTSHESNAAGVIRHRLKWIKEQCWRRSLILEEKDGIDSDGQSWLEVRKLDNRFSDKN